jgi:metallo-beta-lactamase family protein
VNGLVEWYNGFHGKPPLILVHGEAEFAECLSERLRNELDAPVRIAQKGEVIDLIKLPGFVSQ